MNISTRLLLAIIAAAFTPFAHSSVASEPRRAGMHQYDIMGSGFQIKARGNAHLEIQINNTHGADLNAYVSGIDPGTGKAVLLRSDTWQWHVLDPGDSQYTDIPQQIKPDIKLAINVPNQKQISFTLPGFLESGRIWLAEGELMFNTTTKGLLVEPTVANPSLPEYNIKWGFLELSNLENEGIHVNLSFVDWVSLTIGMALTSTNSTGAPDTQNVKGITPESLNDICSEMEAQSRTDSHAEWGRMCVRSQDNTILRVVSPNFYAHLDAGKNSMNDYYSSYVQKVWTKYKDVDLRINTQGAEDGEDLPVAGNGAQSICRVNEDFLKCNGTGDPQFAKPSTTDIWGCTGPFGNETSLVQKRLAARLCAAFARSTLLLEGGEVQPYGDESKYYSENVTNHYSRILHQHLIDGKGYSFPYDDVNPVGQNAAGLLTAAEPKLLQVTVSA
ncbi:hypothetical protein JX265_012386 [Neoarthrinium moseri]|uniref:GH64 domain-containing protein n=1 Tax=Neoarthrinium moseri TaxID=1658444 RepID=A0A9P9WAN3_9PEZI|nr:hypothetical protein JX266_002994 [Neoarthrinium moseri]KAI1855031.1 hypothetical protein JX265_012386 [Neoarthrinium moseri]